MKKPASALLLVAVCSAAPAFAQRMPAKDPLAGVAIPAHQDLSRLDIVQPGRIRPVHGMQAERAARAERQAQYNRNYPGTPVRTYASRR